MEEPIFDFEIVTPFRRVYTGKVKSVVAPGFEGYFGVLARHAPFVSSIKIGEIKVDTGEEVLYFATSGGFAEVLPRKVTILAETAEEAAEIDLARAEAARERAQKRLSEGRKNWDVERAQAALARALNRIKVAHRVA